MFRYVIKSLPHKFSYSTTFTHKWDLLTAVCLERRPIITPLLNELEKDFTKYLSEIERERSYKSDHEVRHERDKRQEELLKKGDADIDASLKQTAQDFADASFEEYNQFKVADRLTSDDKTNNVKSLNRKLDKHLVLLLKETVGDKDFYLLPQGMRQDGESLRQTADRVLKEKCGDDIKAQIYGNAPAGFYKYKYPKNVQSENGTVGAKVFIYFARYNKGQFADKDVEYKWLDRRELKKELPQDYYYSVAQFLMDEN